MLCFTGGSYNPPLCAWWSRHSQLWEFVSSRIRILPGSLKIHIGKFNLIWMKCFYDGFHITSAVSQPGLSHGGRSYWKRQRRIQYDFFTDPGQTRIRSLANNVTIRGMRWCWFLPESQISKFDFATRCKESDSFERHQSAPCIVWPKFNDDVTYQMWR